MTEAEGKTPPISNIPIYNNSTNDSTKIAHGLTDRLKSEELSGRETFSPQALPQALNIPPPEIASEIYLRHRHWMATALSLAEAAGSAGEVPVAAIVVGPDNQAIAQATNRKERDHDPTAHAEVLALRAAGRQLGNWHLNDCTLYVTLEPCAMCAGALVQSRLGALVYGADDIKAGAVRSVLNIPDGPCSNHRLSVLGGILERPCREQLQRWFQQRR